jgi:hypothetical protein
MAIQGSVMRAVAYILATCPRWTEDSWFYLPGGAVEIGDSQWVA